jgi:hypothetical protein
LRAEQISDAADAGILEPVNTSERTDFTGLDFGLGAEKQQAPCVRKRQRIAETRR